MFYIGQISYVQFWKIVSNNTYNQPYFSLHEELDLSSSKWLYEWKIDSLRTSFILWGSCQKAALCRPQLPGIKYGARADQVPTALWKDHPLGISPSKTQGIFLSVGQPGTIVFRPIYSSWFQLMLPILKLLKKLLFKER